MPTASQPPPPPSAPSPAVFTEHVLACGCDPQLWRQILLDTANGVYACMGCGAVGCTEALGDDGRGSGQAHTVYRTLALPEPVLAWLSVWPRVSPRVREPLWWMHPSLHRSDSVYMPATLRCANTEALDAEEARHQELRQTLGLRAALMRAGVPAEPPPTALQQRFAGCAEVWQDLQLNAHSDVEVLIERANNMSALAADLLVARDDVATLLMRTLRAGKPCATLAMLRAAVRVPVDVATMTSLLIDALNAVVMTPRPGNPDRIADWPRVEVLLLIVAEHHCFSPAMSTCLRALMRRLARHDAALASQAGVVLRELGRHCPEAL